jgi:hypothetical protein
MMEATPSANQMMTSATQNGRSVRNIALIVASGLLVATSALRAVDPPTGLLKKISQREAQNADERNNYTYRQTVTVQELDDHGALTGEYREVRDIIFSPKHERDEVLVEKPRSTLKRLILTEEDFADIRNVQPFLLTPDQLFSYEHKFKGEETMDGEPCFVVFVRPRQILSGQRFFEGTIWVRQSDLAVVRSEGVAVPQIQTLSKENLFPHFTTLRQAVDGQWFFPMDTYADDTLYFRQGPQRIRIRIKYSNYKRFGAESTVQFGDQKK